MSEEIPTGKAIGGIARKMALTPERRKEISDKANEAKKAGAQAPMAEYTGKLKLGELEIPCAVLPDGRRVLSQRGVQAALGRKYGGKDFKEQEGGADDGGGRLPFYLAANALKPFINNELAVVASAPILYRHGKGGGVGQGVDAALLPKICDVWLKAREAGGLNKNQLAVAQRAELLMRGLAHVGIIALVDEATGFQRDRERDALAKILEAFVAKELQPYVKTFPPEYYEHLFRLYDLKYPPAVNKSWRPSFFGKITNEVVYARIAPGLLPELKKAASKAERKSKLHRWLTQDIGHPKLKEHLASLVAILKLSRTPQDFMRNVNTVHPRYGSTGELALDDTSEFNDSSNALPPPSSQSQTDV